MSSKAIYQPYCYLIGWSTLNKWYYGVRFSKNCSPSDFWVSYFTSSKHVAKFRKEHGEPNIIDVRKTFNDKLTALRWEHKVLRRLKAHQNPKFLNKSIGLGTKFCDVTGIKQSSTHISNRVTSRQGYCHSAATREKIASKVKNLVSVRDLDGTVIRIDRNDPRASQLLGSTSGTFAAKDSSGNRFQISTNDPRFLSGELVAMSKGRIPWNKKEIRHTDEELEIQSVKERFNIPTSKSGLLWINDGSQKTRVHPLLFTHYYEPRGWVTGRL